MPTRCLLQCKLPDLEVKTLPALDIAVLHVLNTPDPAQKVMAARYASREWRMGRLEHRFDCEMPESPARPATPELLRPRDMPRRGKGTSAAKRTALIHALAHIEFVAIDLAFDMIGRFGAQFPPEFVDDWMRVGSEEAMHFTLLNRRLREMDSFYGAMPAHDGIWDTAKETAHDVAARLAIVPMVLEARGLDITLQTVERFKEQGDHLTAKVLNRIYHDEIRHVSFGTKWFESVCESQKINHYETVERACQNPFQRGVKASI